MKQNTHVCIAYIVGRLIAGKSITSIYDCSQSLEIDGACLPDNKCLTEFTYINWSYLAGSPDICRYQYLCKAGNSIDISVKGNTFIGYIRESSSHFMGTVRGDFIYLYDQDKSAHFNFRISGNSIGH